MRAEGFNAVRLGVNVATALDDASLALLVAVAEGFSHVIVCMWDTQTPSQTAGGADYCVPQGQPGGGTCGHGDGLVGDVGALAAAWSRLGAAFATSPALFEVFNEPFGSSSSRGPLR